jgi:hypothetical protein
MSTDFNIRPVGAPVAAIVPQPVSDAAKKAVATELPASETVSASNAGVNLRNLPGPVSESVSHLVTFDRAAATIVYQAVDSRTNAVVQQFPDEAVLRRRAYFRALDLARSAPTRLVATDRKV